MPEGLTGQWVAPATLSRYVRRYLANRIYAAIKRDAWKSHTRPFSPSPRHHTIGGAGFARPEPTSELIDKHLQAYGTFADDAGQVYDAYVLYTNWDVYTRFFLPDIAGDGFLYPWLGLLANPRARRPFYVKQPDELHRETRMVRNGKFVSEEAATACERLLELEFAELVRPHADRMTELNDQLEGTTDECYAHMCYYLAWHGTDDTVLDSETYLAHEQAWVDGLEGDDYNRAEQVCRVGQKSFLARTLQRLQVQGNRTPGTSGASTSGRSRTGSRRKAIQS